MVLSDRRIIFYSFCLFIGCFGFLRLLIDFHVLRFSVVLGVFCSLSIAFVVATALATAIQDQDPKKGEIRIPSTSSSSRGRRRRRSTRLGRGTTNGRTIALHGCRQGIARTNATPAIVASRCDFTGPIGANRSRSNPQIGSVANSRTSHRTATVAVVTASIVGYIRLPERAGTSGARRTKLQVSMFLWNKESRHWLQAAVATWAQSLSGGSQKQEKDRNSCIERLHGG